MGLLTIALLGALQSAAIAAAAEPAAATCRDRWLQPFASTSIWNTAIGSNAKFLSAGLFSGFNQSHGCALRVSAANRRVSCKSPGTGGDTPEAECLAAGCCFVSHPRPQCFIPAGGIPDAGIHADQDLLVRGAVGDPLTPFLDRAWAGGAECREGGPQRGAVPFPHDYMGDCEDNNNAFALLLGDNETLLQSQPLYRSAPGAAIMAQWPPSSPFGFMGGWNQSILGDGALGAHGGSFLSSIGGTLRVGELTRGVIPHALKIEVFGHDYYWSSLFGPPLCYAWPATACDGYGNHSGWNGYAGLLPWVRPGALLAVPAPLEAQLLARMATAPARTILHALVTYGAYLVDDTAGDSVAICAEPAAIVELQTTFNISINITRPALPHSPGATGDFFADIVLIFQHLAAVVNNAPGSVGGGGVPRAPPAPPICV